jgi:hypothetical protein
MHWFSLSAKAVLSVCVALFLTGCFGPTPVSLMYEPPQTEPARTLSGAQVAMTPFEDARTEQMLMNRGSGFVVAEGEDVGFWVGNALAIELERAGATVEKLDRGAEPQTGVLITGRVNRLQCMTTGFRGGGLLVKAISPDKWHADVNITVQVTQAGVTLHNKNYERRGEFQQDVVSSWFLGANDIQGIRRALSAGLQELFTEQVLPDIERVVR